MDIPHRADVVVIGAGIVGLTVACELARGGMRRVLVFDAGEPGQQSTGRSAGGIRQQFGSELEVRLSQAGLAFYQPILADPDFEGRFDRDGYLFLAGRDQCDALRAAWTVQAGLGVPSEWLEPPAVAARYPYIDLTDLSGATFCGEDGFLDPWPVVQWLLRQGRTMGVGIVRQQRVEGMVMTGGRLDGVRAGTATVATALVVNAAGAWAGAVAALAGASVPVSPSPRVKVITEPQDELPPTTPLIVDLTTGSYVRCVHRRVTAGLSPTPIPIGYEIADAFDIVERIAANTAHRFPALQELRVSKVVSGLYEVTPDGLPVAGAAGGIEGLWTVAGFNGHGIMHGPPVACAVADAILGRPPRIDLGPFSPGRFGTGAAFRERRSSLI